MYVTKYTYYQNYLKHSQVLICAFENRYTKRNKVLESTIYQGGGLDPKAMQKCKIQSILLLQYTSEILES